jgi:hypothetical protein
MRQPGHANISLSVRRVSGPIALVLMLSATAGCAHHDPVLRLPALHAGELA